MNTQSKPGTYGTKKSSWDHGPRKLFREVKAKHPLAPVDVLATEFTKALDNHAQRGAITASIMLTWVANADAAFRIMTDEEREEAANARATVRAEKKTKNKLLQETAVKIAENLINQKAHALIMDCVQVNGKLGRDCTGDDWKGIVSKTKRSLPLAEFLATTLKPREKTSKRFETDAQIKKAMSS